MNPLVHTAGAGIRSMALSLAATTLVSFLLSSLATFLCVLFAGAGHAAASPGLTFFAPLWAFPVVVEMSPGAYQSYVNWGPAVMAGYYCIYGVGIALARFRGRGKLALALVLLVHYTGLWICMNSFSWDGLQNMWIVSDRYGAWIVIVLVELFVVLHLLAFQYAWSEIPYRPKLTKSAAIVLGAGLLAGVLVHILAIAQAPEGAL